VLAIAFLVVAGVGAVLLTLPMASADGTWTNPGVALFTATSAVSVTGISVVETGTYWSGFGQVVIAALVQVGGFGFMTGSTLLLSILVGRRTSLSDRILVQASTDATDLGGVTGLIRRVAIFTLVVEGIGAVVLAIGFVLDGEDALTALWWGVFHAISAFNNAGFDLFGAGNSLARFQGDLGVLVPIALLILLGGLGFAIVGDVAVKRRWIRLALETKIVLLTTAAIIVVGTLAITGIEWDNPGTLGALPPIQRPFSALFETITLRSAGFSVLPTGSFLDETLFVAIAMMFIGGASGSTAGGIKVNTFSVLLIAIVSTIRGDPAPMALGRRISPVTVYRAVAIALLSVAVVFVLAFGVGLLTTAPFIDVLFESVSALGTVGASVGVTADASPAARILLTVAMFIGRLGPLTFILALAARERTHRHQPALEAIRIG
jgi:trk system potassium uptake protein